FADVLLAIFNKSLQFCARLHAAVCCRATDFLTPGAISWFFRANHRLAGPLEKIKDAPDLGRLACAVDAFDGYQDTVVGPGHAMPLQHPSALVDCLQVVKQFG